MVTTCRVNAFLFAQVQHFPPFSSLLLTLTVLIESGFSPPCPHRVRSSLTRAWLIVLGDYIPFWFLPSPETLEETGQQPPRRTLISWGQV